MPERERYPLDKKIQVILDGAAKHHSDLVRDAALVLKIEHHYLPHYSPNLNPIVRLWKVMNIRGTMYISKIKENSVKPSRISVL